MQWYNIELEIFFIIHWVHFMIPHFEIQAILVYIQIHLNNFRIKFLNYGHKIFLDDIFWNFVCSACLTTKAPLKDFLQCHLNQWGYYAVIYRIIHDIKKSKPFISQGVFEKCKRNFNDLIWDMSGHLYSLLKYKIKLYIYQQLNAFKSRIVIC